MVKKNCYLWILVMILVSSCSQDQEIGNSEIGGKDKNIARLSVPEYLSIAYDGDNELSDDEADSILSEFIFFNSNKTRSTANIVFEKKRDIYLDTNAGDSKTRSTGQSKLKIVEYVIKSSTTRTSSSNVSEDGFALVSADKRYPNVLALVETGQLENAYKVGADLMVIRAQDVALHHVEEIGKYQDSLRDNTVNKLTAQFKLEEFSFDEIKGNISVELPDYSAFEESSSETYTTRSSATSYPPGTPVVQLHPLIDLEWIQGYPQNLFIKMLAPADEEIWSGYGGRYPAGCTAVAVTQALSFFKPTIYSTDLNRNVNWNLALQTKQMTYGSATSESVKEAAAIMAAVSRGVKTKFGPNGGSANMSDASAFMRGIGISIDGRSALSYFTIRPSIGAYRPVILTGTSRNVGWRSGSISTRSDYTTGSHAWVMDGCFIMQRNARMELKQYNNYGHCNFGWVYGMYNGWYLFDAKGAITFDVGSDKYDIDLAAYPNIRR